MTVKYYIFGNEAGQPAQSGSGGIPSDAIYGPGEPTVGTLAAGNTTLTFSSATKAVSIRNTHDTLAMDYSLDGGVTWQILAAYGDIREFISISTLMLRNTGVVGATYEVVGILQ